MTNRSKLLLCTLIGVMLVTACGTKAPQTASSQGAIPTSIQSATSTPTPEPLPTVDPQARAGMEKIEKLCATTQPGQVCFGQGPIQAEVQPGRMKWRFFDPGEVTNLADLQRLKVGEAGSADGLALLRIPSENEGKYFTVVAFGDVELVNQVPYGDREFNGMQSMKLTTGPNKEGEMPKNGLLVQAPGDGILSTLVVNGVEMTFGSTALLTSAAGSMTVQTLAGIVSVNTPGQTKEVVQGSEAEVPLEPLTGGTQDEDLLTPLTGDLTDEDFPVPLTQEDDLLEPLVSDPVQLSPEDQLILNLLEPLLPKNPDSYAESLLNSIHNMIKRMLAEREKQKNWKGGWWKETYGPQTKSGTCNAEAVGDGAGGGGSSEPYSREVPVCRGNNGNTILMYDSGTSYDRIGPNTYAASHITEMDMDLNGTITTNGNLETLRVVSPTRLVITYTSSSEGCTTTNVVYLDFLRDDPAVRCGKIIDLFPHSTKITPVPTPTVPAPTRLEDPPVEGEYTVRMAIPADACDAKAKTLAPDFKTARLSYSAEKNLVLETDSKQYELELTGLPISYYSAKTEDRAPKLGVYNLDQPLDATFRLMMSLTEIPGQVLSGEWLVTNSDGSQTCSGSMDLAASK